MKIISIVKKRGLYLVSFEGAEETFTLSEELIYALSWKKGKDVSLDKHFFEKLEEDKERQCFHLALRKLDYSPLSSTQLKWKLKKEGFSEEQISRCLEKLKRMDLINDEYLSKRIVEEYAQKRFSKEKIREKLYERGLSNSGEEWISSCMTSEMEEENALVLAKKKLKLLGKYSEQEKKKKLYQFLGYRGFSYEVVNRIVERILSEENSEKEMNYF